MAPDRGSDSLDSSHLASSTLLERIPTTEDPRNQRSRFLARRASEGQNFTLRGVLVGLFVGSIICFSNMYFGLQAGWVSMMSMPASLIGFALFKAFSKHLSYPFRPVENVLIQTIAVSVGTMPLTAGLVAVIPAIEYLLIPAENGPMSLSLWKLICWSMGLCFFGVAFAVPLRKQVIIREKLKFPSGTATALMITVLHGKPGKVVDSAARENATPSEEEPLTNSADVDFHDNEVDEYSGRDDWQSKIRALVGSFSVSAVYTVLSYFVPILRDLPILGSKLAKDWLWTFNPSPGYIGQGIVMGPTTTIHMLIGAIFGWGILSPLAKSRGWAPGPVADWETGSKGWIVWVSLAIMLSDALVNLGWLILRPVYHWSIPKLNLFIKAVIACDYKGVLEIMKIRSRYESLPGRDSDSTTTDPQTKSAASLPDVDAPAEHLVSNKTVLVSLGLSILLCIASIHIVFGSLVPFYATLVSVVLALLLSVMGVRALGETDLNPVSGISKLTQLVFALIIPQSNVNSVLINLIAGAVSEAGAQQAGDIMQDLKTGHLVGAAPKAQFWGQIIGSAYGAILAPCVYRLYTRVYPVPGDLFQIPTGFVWIFTARLVTGQGLPPMARDFALVAAAAFALLSVARIATANTPYQKFIPGGIAVAVGMYNVPSFTIARTIGGLFDLWWRKQGKDGTNIIILASGLILGEGVFSIVNLVLASAGVKHM
jgi:OPT family oligopeptide transporter